MGLKVAHFAPFAPNRCGLYEAARDCARADALRGHEVVFVDTGICVGGAATREPGKPGQLDGRGGWLLRTVDPKAAHDADVWVCHDGVADSIAVQCQSPMVWMLHGRPLACFRSEQNGSKGNPFSIVPHLASWPRVKALVTMWSEHEDAWRMVCGDKIRSTIDPPIDGERFRPDGHRRVLVKRGRENVLICDSWRDDIDIYEVAVAAYLAAAQRPGMRVHFWAVEPERQGPWQHVWAALDKIGALGEIHGREADIEQVYRSMDLLVSPHSITVRTIGEAMACGLPVVAGLGQHHAMGAARPDNASGFASEITKALDAILLDRRGERSRTLESAQAFSLETFGGRMEAIYREAMSASVMEVATA